jgi:hypothetical protein
MQKKGWKHRQPRDKPEFRPFTFLALLLSLLLGLASLYLLPLP